MQKTAIENIQNTQLSDDLFEIKNHRKTHEKTTTKVKNSQGDEVLLEVPGFVKRKVKRFGNKTVFFFFFFDMLKFHPVGCF